MNQKSDCVAAAAVVQVITWPKMEASLGFCQEEVVARAEKPSFNSSALFCSILGKN